MKPLLKILCLILILFSAKSWSNPLSEIQSEQLEIISIIEDGFLNKYAHKEYKESLGWNIKPILKSARDQIYNAGEKGLERNNFGQLVKSIMSSAKDYHVWARVEYSRKDINYHLPFAIHSSSEFTVVKEVFSEEADKKNHFEIRKIKAGDIIHSFCDVPAQEAKEKIRKKLYPFSKNKNAELSRASGLLTIRENSLKIPPGEQEECNLLVSRPSRGNKPFLVRLYWQGEYDERFIHSESLPTNLRNSQPQYRQTPFFLPELPNPPIKYILPKYPFYKKEPTTFITVLEDENGNELRMAYLRLQQLSYNRKTFEKMGRWLTEANEITDHLVIDLAGNPGGSLLTTYSLISLFYDGPDVQVPETVKSILPDFLAQSDRMRVPLLKKYIESNDANNLDEILNKWLSKNGYPKAFDDKITAESLLNFWSQRLKDNESGKKYSHLDYAWLKYIRSHPTWGYKKPVTVLMDAHTGSAAESFAALFKHFNLGYLFGQTTAGNVGETFYEYPFEGKKRDLLFKHGIDDLAWTSGEITFEGFGILEDVGISPTPGLEHKITLDDLRHGYRDYAKKLFDHLFQATLADKD